MDAQQKKHVARIAADLSKVFTDLPYSYRLQEGTDQDGIRTTVFLRIAYTRKDQPLPVTVLPPLPPLLSCRPVEPGALVRRKWYAGGPIMTVERKARNGWEGWSCSWFGEDGGVFRKWFSTEELEVVK